ncbi:MAG: hypothetical protein RR877_10350 [Aurantimicrobium sp.]|uniref:hypothetical protein n=1 Tax=Aurantimicrobium sp. TaxID=1930784 RepID=UPI002FC64B1E
MTDKAIRKLAFSYAGETCPAVDSWFDYLTDELVEKFGGEDEDTIALITERVDDCRERVKADGTILLRDAMYSMAVDMISLEHRATEAEARNGS